jgi:hypothetical protein
MDAKYYVAVRPQTNDYHSVHKEGCPFLHNDSKKIYLGIFRSGLDAIKESRNSFARTENCYFCCREEKVNMKRTVIADPAEQDTVTVRLHKPESILQRMLCCLN